MLAGLIVAAVIVVALVAQAHSLPDSEQLQSYADELRESLISAEKVKATDDALWQALRPLGLDEPVYAGLVEVRIKPKAEQLAQARAATDEALADMDQDERLAAACLRGKELWRTGRESFAEAVRARSRTSPNAAPSSSQTEPLSDDWAAAQRQLLRLEAEALKEMREAKELTVEVYRSSETFQRELILATVLRDYCSAKPKQWERELDEDGTLAEEEMIAAAVVSFLADTEGRWSVCGPCTSVLDALAEHVDTKKVRKWARSSAAAARRWQSDLARKSRSAKP